MAAYLVNMRAGYVRHEMTKTDAGDTAGQPPLRERLILGAVRLLDEAGQDGVTMRAVAAAAGVSTMASYRHFADKQALLVAVATADFDRLGEEMDAAARSRDTAIEQLGEILATYVRYGVDHPARYTLMFGREISAAQDAAFATSAMSVFRRIEALVAGVHTGGPDDEPAHVIAGMLLTCAHGAIDLHVQGHVTPVKGLGDPEQLVRRLAARLLGPVAG
jgi:AcrR family transcriptional regulator